MKKFLRKIILFFRLVNYLYLYRKIEKSLKIDKNEYAFLCNVHPGDTYLFCALMEEFVKEYKSKVTIVVNENQAAIPTFFPSISRVVTLKKLPDFRFNSIFCKYEHIRIGRLNIGYRPNNDDLMSKLVNYFNIDVDDVDFVEPYIFYLGLKSRKISIPTIKSEWRKAAISRFERFNLPEHRTVILAPYAKSVKPIDFNWWIKIRDILLKSGFQPVTNVGLNEKPIEGTQGITIPFEEIIPFSELAGWVIGIRSGLMDILSSSKCKLTVLYPEQFVEFNNDKVSVKVINNFGLKKINNRIEEYEINHDVQPSDDIIEYMLFSKN